MSVRLLRYGVATGAALVNHDAFRAAPARTLGRAGLWLLHAALRREARVTLLGATLTVPPRLRKGGATSVYVLRDHYDPELRWLASMLTPGMVVVDGGANLGVYAMVASSKVGPEGHVFAFEPGAASFAYLERNVARAANVTAFRAALSSEPGEQSLFQVNGAPNSYSLAEGPEMTGFELVRVTTIDETIGDTRLDVLKLDVEGAEELALRGAQRALEHRPVVLFEVNPLRAKALGCEPDGAWRLLAGLGYRLHSLRAGTLHGEETPREGNMIALPGP